MEAPTVGIVDNNENSSRPAPVDDTATDFERTNREMRERWLQLADELEAAVTDGDTASQTTVTRELEKLTLDFYNGNAGLFKVLARRFCPASERGNHDDVYAAAASGMWEAFLKWDPDRATFGTFSRPYIKGRIQREVAKLEHHGLSYGDWSARQTVMAAWNKLSEELGHEPTFEQVAAKAETTVGVVKQVMQPKATSLDAVVGDGTMSLSDLLPDAASRADYDDIDLEQVTEAVTHRLAQELDGLGFYVLLRRVEGLDFAPTQTLVEISDDTGIGREVVRRREVLARGRMKELLTDQITPR